MIDSDSVLRFIEFIFFVGGGSLVLYLSMEAAHQRYRRKDRRK